MNITLVFLLLLMLFTIVWHFNFIKNEKQIHNSIIQDIEEKILCEENKSATKNSIIFKVNHEKVINFKISIIKQQLELLSVISNQNQN